MYQKHSETTQALAEKFAGKLLHVAADATEQMLKAYSKQTAAVVDELLSKKELLPADLTRLLGPREAVTGPAATVVHPIAKAAIERFAAMAAEVAAEEEKRQVLARMAESEAAQKAATMAVDAAAKADAKAQKATAASKKTASTHKKKTE
jgi:hypothetical protein